jgi:uncharacterized protein YbaP (TraB family)
LLAINLKGLAEMKLIWRLLCLSVLLVVSGFGGADSWAAATKTEKHLLWRTEIGSGSVYLLGSIHFGTPEMYPLPAVMISAFNQADALVVEADVLNIDPTQMAQLVADKAMYRDGSSLQQHVSAKTWRDLTKATASLGLPVELLGPQKPWFASMTLTALALNKIGFREDLGIDQHFLQAASGKKKIIELESLAWQLGLFEQLSEQEQVIMLEETLRELDQGKDFFDRMLSAWQAGSASGINDLFAEGLSKDAASEHLNKLIMIDRNRSMAAKIEKMAKQGGRYFVVVGAGHLVGDESIVALLKKWGYQVDQQ